MARRTSVDPTRTPIVVRVDGAEVRAYRGDTVAAVLVAAGLPTMRSLKYHRPRGPFCMEGHCGSCMMRIDGEPNLRACMTLVRDGMEIRSQNALPTAHADALGAIDRAFPRGLDHHGIMTSAKLPNRIAKVVVRQLSGQGTLPAAAAHGADPASSLPARAQRVVCDVLVIGGGISGMEAARASAARGAQVVVVDDRVATPTPSTSPASVRVLAQTSLLGVYHEQGTAYALAHATCDQAIFRIEPRAWVWATGSYAQNAAFPDNDRPHVYALRAARRLLANDVLVGEQVLIAADAASATEAAALEGDLAAHGAVVQAVSLAALVDGVVDVERFDAICVAHQRAPAFEGAAQQGCRVAWDVARGGFFIAVDAAQQTSLPGVFASGDVTGTPAWDGDTDAAHRDACLQGARAGEGAAAHALAEVTQATAPRQESSNV